MYDIESFDVVWSVIGRADLYFGECWELDKSKCLILESYCKAIDDLAKEFDGECFEVEVDEVKMTVNIKLICREIYMEKNDVFYNLTERAEKISLKYESNDKIGLTFVFPSVWNKVT